MADPIHLSVTEISDAIQVIDHAAEQGAYRGWDTIRQVLALRDRLAAFVAAVNASDPTPQPEPRRRGGQPSKEIN